ncbi:MAG: hypothetical protein Q4C58_15625 [Eubacteriales bacterium]|nr:hypothetical protein [Eubacteriales bacterium]
MKRNNSPKVSCYALLLKSEAFEKEPINSEPKVSCYALLLKKRSV